ncbi:PTS transporter subunit EIIB [Mycoplasma sp. ATU-Cv-508]|uniref:PTS transporter subunit EIIB n=1 Tax=Mycoplasma sp. ATU-Cv-508 TaxID=2048001 RepID=UPI001375305D
MVEGFGGWDNIKTYTNCASRLRYDVYDPSKVKTSKFKQAGAFGVQKWVKPHYQIIFGPASEQINAKLWRQEVIKCQFPPQL